MSDEHNFRGVDAREHFRDEDLRARFAALRRQEEARVPAFVLPAAGAGRHGWAAGRLVLVPAVGVAILGLVLWMRIGPGRPASHHGGPVASIAEWKAPTDFLLETPGRDLLRRVPSIGEIRSSTVVSKSKQKNSRTH